MPNTQKNNPRLKILLFGRRVGKTRTALKLAEESNYALIISTDHGAIEGYLDNKKYKGFLRIYECFDFQGIKRAFGEADGTVQELTRKGVSISDIWVVLDTATHLQTLLLTEAHKTLLKQAAPDYTVTEAGFFEKLIATKGADEDAHLTLMTECMDRMNQIPCNTVSVCLEQNNSAFPEPALWGKAARQWINSADIHLRMVRNEEGKSYFELNNQGGFGDRFGILDDQEESNLRYLRDKLYYRLTTK